MSDPILARRPLGFPWVTVDPFLFCVHHLDHYPEGNASLGPAESLAGRRMGMDFEGKDGWRMYHGDVVPGFPRHPHRGFETVTIARRGFIDHSDSLGAKARFGHGDVQWMTAGRGIVHSEMFPLLEEASPNPVELFQIWVNLPAEDKMAEPHFAMLWSESIPRRSFGPMGQQVHVTAFAGKHPEMDAPPPPPPRSWAAREGSDVALWTLVLEPGARLTLPPATSEARRMLYFFEGEAIELGGVRIAAHGALEVAAARPLELGTERGAEVLLMQGRPIGEPVAHHGPFVMNQADELRQAFVDFQRTGFGGWPWDRDDPVHGPSPERFAVHIDGREDRP